jgi:hypothetical protein
MVPELHYLPKKNNLNEKHLGRGKIPLIKDGDDDFDTGCYGSP